MLLVEICRMSSESPLLVHANFLDDLRQILTERMRVNGIKMPPDANAGAVLVEYLNSQGRLIEMRSRQVFWSRELLARKLPPNVSLAVRAIEQASAGGSNLNPYLSMRVQKVYNDMLLNDWGINHLHLGLPGAGPPPFVGRTGTLLYVYVAEETLYFVDVRSHESFDDQVLIEIVHNNWPHLLAKSRAVDVPGGHPLSREQRARLRGKVRGRRRGAVNALTQMADGTVYFPHGGGYVMKGLSLAVRVDADVRHDRICRHERWCKNNGDVLAAAIFERTERSLAELRLSLRLDDGDLLVVETQSGVQFKIND